MRFFLQRLTLTEDKRGLKVYVVGAADDVAGARSWAVAEPPWHRCACASVQVLGRVAVGVGCRGSLASGPYLFKKNSNFFPMISIAPT
jgi:hypothetical protein